MQIIISFCSSNHLRIKKSVYNEGTLYIARSLHCSFRFILHSFFFFLWSVPGSCPLQTESPSFPCPLSSDWVQAIAGSNRKSQEGRENWVSIPCSFCCGWFPEATTRAGAPLKGTAVTRYRYSFLPAPGDLETGISPWLAPLTLFTSLYIMPSLNSLEYVICFLLGPKLVKLFARAVDQLGLIKYTI